MTPTAPVRPGSADRSVRGGCLAPFAALTAAVLPAAAALWPAGPLAGRAALLDPPDAAALAPDRWRGLDAARVEWMLETTRGGLRQPLAWMSLGLDHAVGGSVAASATSQVLLHAACAAVAGLLVLALLRRTGAARLWPVGAPLAAALAAAAWAVHPLRIEPVATLSARGDVLATLFGLAATLLWTRAVGGADLRRGALAGAVVAAALAAAASPAAVAIIPAAWALAVWLGRTAPDSRAARGELGGPLTLLAVGPVVAFLATWSVRAPSPDVPIAARVASAGHAVLAPLWNTLWPFAAHPFRDPPPGFPSEDGALAAWWVQTAIAALLLLRAAARLRRPRRGAGGGAAALVACAAAALVAWTLGHGFAASDTAAYAATLPLFVAAGVALGEGAGCCLAFFGLPLVAGAALFPAWLARDAAATWRDDASLAGAVLAADPGNDRVNAALSAAALRAGDFTEAETRARRGLGDAGFRPHSETALARVAAERGDVAAAAAGLERAVAEAPHLADAWLHLGLVRLRQGRSRDAVDALRTATRLDAESPAAWFALARAHLADGSRDRAADAFERVLALDPADGRAREELDRLR